MIYEPKEDSFLLEKEVKDYSRGKVVLDMGAGSGILGIAALKSGAKSVVFADVDEEPVNYLKNNGYNAINSDLFSNVKGAFDLIIFNPPYLPFDSREDLESSRVTSGGKRGDEIIIRFLENVEAYLNEKGVVLIIISSLTPKRMILKVLKDRKFTWKIISKKKFFMEELKVWEIRKL